MTAIINQTPGDASGPGGLGASTVLIPLHLPGGYTAGDLAKLGFMPQSTLAAIQQYQVPGLVLADNGLLYKTNSAPQSLNDWVNMHVANTAEAATNALGNAANVVGTAAYNALHPLERALPWIIGGGLVLGYLVLGDLIG